MTRKLNGKTKEEKAAYWKAYIEKFKKYEGSAHDYCLSEQIPYSTFQNWRRKLVPLKPSGFVPVVVATNGVTSQALKHQKPVSPDLPDAVWVAEFILRLQQGAR
jgi:hypothetical protein